jgi:AP endonuclease-1
MGITAFQHILQDPRTRNIPLIVETPSFDQPMVVWGKEIAVLQALTSIPPATQSEEDLQSLVDELRSAVDIGRLLEVNMKKLAESRRRGKRVVKSKSKSTELTDNVVDRSAESYQTSQKWPEL